MLCYSANYWSLSLAILLLRLLCFSADQFRELILVNCCSGLLFVVLYLSYCLWLLASSINCCVVLCFALVLLMDSKDKWILLYFAGDANQYRCVSSQSQLPLPLLSLSLSLSLSLLVCLFSLDALYTKNHDLAWLCASDSGAPLPPASNLTPLRLLQESLWTTSLSRLSLSLSLSRIHMHASYSASADVDDNESAQCVDIMRAALRTGTFMINAQVPFTIRTENNGWLPKLLPVF